MVYRKDIDGLRAIAVVPVILFHAGYEFFSGGYVGVDIFFVISGYLITLLILNEVNSGNFSFLSFYERRARRLLPALFVVLAVTTIFSYLVLMPSDLISFAKSLVSVQLFSSNFYFWSERGYFGAATELKPLIHTWSLAIEEQYYFIAPLLTIWMVRKCKVLTVWLLSFLLFASSFALCIYLSFLHVDSAFYLFPARAWELLAGSIAAALAYGGYSKRVPDTYASMLSFLGFSLILVSICSQFDNTAFPGYIALIPVFGTFLMVLFVRPNMLLAKCLGSWIFVKIGIISYSLYLIHQPIFSLVRYSLGSGFFEKYAILFVLISVVLSVLSVHYVEKPFRKSGVFSRKQIVISSISLFFLFLIVGVLGVVNKGYIDRFSHHQQKIAEDFIDPGLYTSSRFNSMLLKEFNDGDKINVVLIGDSFAQDLTNAVYESKLSELFELSTFRINAECGNLYKVEDFQHYIADSSMLRCQTLGWYSDELKRRMAEADEIWLASSWLPWVVQYLPESVSNLEAEFSIPVFVFGSKSFGEVSQNKLMKLSQDEQPNYAIALTREFVSLEMQLAATIDEKNYIDVHSLLCDSLEKCRIFERNGKTITFDGVHLTKTGAKKLGDALLNSPNSKRLIEAGNSNSYTDGNGFLND